MKWRGDWGSSQPVGGSGNPAKTSVVSSSSRPPSSSNLGRNLTNKPGYVLFNCILLKAYAFFHLTGTLHLLLELWASDQFRIGFSHQILTRCFTIINFRFDLS